MRVLAMITAVAVGGMAVAGCQTQGNTFSPGGWGTGQTVGTVGGAAAGGLLGSQFGSGSGQLAATAIGTLLGAFVGAVSQRRFRLATFSDPADTLRNLGGAMLMGVGGVVALGCTIGQAVTGTSTLAAGSLITFACIVIGGLIGMKAMEAMV